MTRKMRSPELIEKLKKRRLEMGIALDNIAGRAFRKFAFGSKFDPRVLTSSQECLLDALDELAFELQQLESIIEEEEERNKKSEIAEKL